jgi:hypothetical protein
MKSARWILIISLAVAIVPMVVMAFIALAGKGSQVFGSDWEEGDATMMLIMVPVVLVIVFFSLRPFWHLFFPRKLKNPVEAEAKVLKVWDTGVSVNDNPQVGLMLEVRPPLGSPQGVPFEVEAKTLVSRLNAALVQPGVMAKVRYEAADPKLMEVLSFDVQAVQAGEPAERQPSSAERLQELADLRARNLVSEEEYTRKREEILKEL